jgi:hypothetical protein
MKRISQKSSVDLEGIERASKLRSLAMLRGQ